MKKVTSLILAVISTAFLAIGSARAADLVDAMQPASKKITVADFAMDGPAIPCLGGDPTDPN